MKPLTAQRFPEFFRELHGTAPYPWQERLAARVANAVTGDRAWPNILALPTGSGKTSCLEIAVFALACQADRDPPSRTAARRIFFVIDRRVVVDQAYEHACAMATRLHQAADGVLYDVASRLRSIGHLGDNEPLAAVQLRGGVYREPRWIRTPNQPTIVATTVDQVGSRLLFRGYGVTPTARALHAGLLANDSLFILDEAHCSAPFAETLAAVGRYNATQSTYSTPFHVVSMTATPSDEASPDVFRLDDADRRHPALGRRLNASKQVRLVVAPKAKAGDHHAAVAHEAVEQARRMAGDGAKAIAIVVNRVRTAKVAYEQFRRLSDTDVVLMTGRMRPLDRDFVQRRIRTLMSSAEQGHLARPLYVVATQCLEVGADFDFDVMVTECASLDALRQRFGRLNRTGRLEVGHGCVVVRADQQEPEPDEDQQDPVYGNAIAHTWRWLQSRAAKGYVDFSAHGMDAGGASSELNVAPEHAPVLLPAHLDCWVQTEPAPKPSPDVAPFLHGPKREEPDVYVCWRGDLPAPSVTSHVALRNCVDTISLCPPSANECLPVPLRRFTRWFRAGIDGSDIADVEGARAGAEESEPEELPGHLRPVVLRWRGDQSDWIETERQVTAGDVLVLPSVIGGWDALGYVPEPWNTAATVDRGDEGHLLARRRSVLRLHPSLLDAWPDSDGKDKLVALARLQGPDAHPSLIELREIVTRLAPGLAGGDRNELSEARGVVISHLGRFRAAPHPLGGVVLIGARIGTDSYDLTDEEDLLSLTGHMDLEAHCLHVGDYVRRLGESCGLPPSLVADMEIAARFHDAGKADERFQAWLNGGSLLVARTSGVLLAKTRGGSPQARRRARELSGYPEAGRHELLSVRLIESAPRLLAEANDPDLVLHLVGTHHGYCRPFAPVTIDDSTESTEVEMFGHVLAAPSVTRLERLESGISERFWRLVRRYGWWGVAGLEALFRLADWRASELEQAANDVAVEEEEVVSA